MFGLVSKKSFDELKEENERQRLYIGRYQNDLALAKAATEAVKVDSDRFEKEVQSLLAYKKDNETLMSRVASVVNQLSSMDLQLKRAIGGRFLVEEELKALKESYLKLAAKK